MILENLEKAQKCIVGNQFVMVMKIAGRKAYAKKEDAKEAAMSTRIVISTMLVNFIVQKTLLYPEYFYLILVHLIFLSNQNKICSSGRRRRKFCKDNKCTKDSECENAACIYGKCKSECSRNRPCPFYKSCRNHVCEDCRRDSDCDYKKVV